MSSTPRSRKYDLIDWLIQIESPRLMRGLLLTLLGIIMAIGLFGHYVGSDRRHELELPPGQGMSTLIGEENVIQAKGASLIILSELKAADAKGLDSAAALADLRLLRSNEF